MSAKEIFGQRLSLLREQRKVTQQAIVNVVGISTSHLSEMEHGRRTATYEKLIALADYFGVSTDYLLGRTDNPEINR